MKRWWAAGAVLGAAIAAWFFRPPAAPSGMQPEPFVRESARPASGWGVEAGPRAVVYVVGAVARPGLYTLGPSARVDDAVKSAGGFLPAAERRTVDLAARVQDGEEIDVRTAAEAAACAAPPRAAGRHGRRRRAASPAPAEQLDLNRANADELGRIPSIGPALAARIVAFRQLNGPFDTVDEVLDVAGMTPQRLNGLAARVMVR